MSHQCHGFSVFVSVKCVLQKCSISAAIACDGARCARGQNVEDTLHRLCHHSQDAVTCNALIAACGTSSHWQLASYILAHMPAPPDSISLLAAESIGRGLSLSSCLRRDGTSGRTSCEKQSLPEQLRFCFSYPCMREEHTLGRSCCPCLQDG